MNRVIEGNLLVGLNELLVGGKIKEAYDFMERMGIETFGYHPCLNELALVRAFPFGCFKGKRGGFSVHIADMWLAGSFNEIHLRTWLNRYKDQPEFEAIVLEGIPLTHLASVRIVNAYQKTRKGIANSEDKILWLRLTKHYIGNLITLPGIDYAFMWSLHPACPLFDRPIEPVLKLKPKWSRALHHTFDKPFRQQTKTILLMRQHRSAQFPMPKDLIPLLLSHLFDAHIELLETKAIAFGQQAKSYFGLHVWELRSFKLSDGNIYQVCSTDTEAISICLMNQRGQNVAHRRLAYAVLSHTVEKHNADAFLDDTRWFIQLLYIADPHDPTDYPTALLIKANNYLLAAMPKQSDVNGLKINFRQTIAPLVTDAERIIQQL